MIERENLLLILYTDDKINKIDFYRDGRSGMSYFELASYQGLWRGRSNDKKMAVYFC